MKVEKLSKNIWIEFNPFVLNKINLSKDHNIGEKLFCPLFDKAVREIFPESWRYFCMGNPLVVGLVEKMGKTLSK